MRDIIIRTTAASGVRDGAIRYWLSSGPGNLDLTPAAGATPGFFVIVFGGLAYPARWYSEGLKVMTTTYPIKPPLYAITKATNYLPNVLMQMEAKEAGLDNGVFIDDDGFVGESSNMNVAFVTTDGVLRHPRSSASSPAARRCGATSNRRSDVQPDRMWSNLVPQHAVRGDERHVHVRALADVAVLVDEDAVVEARLLGLHLHQDVRQIVRGLGDRVERRLDRIRRRHHACKPSVYQRSGISEAGEHHDEESRRRARAGEIEVAGPGRQPVANRAVPPPAGGGRADDDVAHLLARSGSFSLDRSADPRNRSRCASRS